jgi:hypothetical protein
MKDDLVNNISLFFLLWVKYPGRLLLLLIKSLFSLYLGICTTKTDLQNGVYITCPFCQIIHDDLVNIILLFFLLWVKYPGRLLLLLLKSPPLSTWGSAHKNRLTKWILHYVTFLSNNT